MIDFACGRGLSELCFGENTMPMMVVSDEDFKLEIDRVIVDYRTVEKGRNGKAEVPNEVRKLVASEALAGVSIDEIKEKYNVSASSISAYKNDATSTASYHKPDTDLAENNKIVKATISDRAEGVILESIGLLTLERLDKAKARDIAGIAKDMSAVISNMRENGSGNGSKVNITIMVPPIREESDFKVIDMVE